MKLIFTILLAIASMAGMNAQTEHYEKLFSEGNELYSRKSYDSALTVYNSILESGYLSAELYYNTGNTYYKLDQIPSSILMYERALKLAPDDNDIRFNLEAANQRITDKMEAIPEWPIGAIFRNLLNIQTTEGWAWMALGFCLWAAVSFAWFKLGTGIGTRRAAFYIAILSVVISLVSLAAASAQMDASENANEGIVFTPSVTIKSSPEETSTDLFVIHEGLKVKILEEVNLWLKISLPDGNVGWLKSGDIRKI